MFDKFGIGYVSFLSLCQAFELDPTSQLVILQGHEVTADGLVISEIAGEDSLLLRLDALALWLVSLPREMVEQTKVAHDLFILRRSGAFLLQDALATGQLTDISMAGWLQQGDSASAFVYWQSVQLMLLAREYLRLAPLWNVPKHSL